jgi:hypothetical protein
MASPNIANVQSIFGKTDVVADVSNSSGSPSSILNGATDKLYKVNTLMAANLTGASVEITLLFNTGTTEVSLAHEIVLPPGSSLALVGKDTPLYVDEDAEIKAYSNTASAVDIVISYEEIDDV